MKKLIVATVTLLTLTATTKASPNDGEYGSSIGVLTLCSDMAGIGTVLETGYTNNFPVGHSLYEHSHEYITLQVEESFYGGSNQQIVVVNFGLASRSPPESERIVFFVRSNEYNFNDVGNWNLENETRKVEGVESDYIPPGYKFSDDYNHAWFSPNADNGLIFNYTTNIIYTLRTERNWTNYYEVVRNGVTSPSERVSEDSKFDLLGLIQFADPAQLLFMKNDPLFPVELKDLLPK